MPFNPSWRREGIPDDAEAFWNRDFETLEPERLHELEVGLIPRIVMYAARKSPWYAQRMKDAGVDPMAVRSHDDLASLPLLDKRELAAVQADRRGVNPIGPHLCAEWTQVKRVQATGGTTTQPLRFAMTELDIAVYEEMGARALWAMGCRPTDTVVHTMNYSLYAGGVSDHMAFERLGAAVMPFGVGESRRLLAVLTDLAGTSLSELSLYATPSYALRLIEVASEHGVDIRELGVRKAFVSGEGGLQSPRFRARLEDAFGCAATDLYGTAETGAQSGECPDRSGLHFAGAGLLLAELVDPSTGRPVAFSDGAEGELVLTTLVRQACPLLRFRTGDVIRVHPARCGCGRQTFRFFVQGRSDDMFIVKGVNVFPSAIHAVLGAFGGELSGAFQVVVPRKPFAEPRLRVEARMHNDHTAGEVMERVRRSVRDALGWSPVVQLEPPGSLASPGPEGGKGWWVVKESRRSAPSGRTRPGVPTRRSLREA